MVIKMVFNKRKIIFLSSLFSVIFLTGIIFLTSRLTKQRQEIRKKAASPTGTATISFSPASGNFSVGQTFPVAVKINLNGANISSAQISFNYSFASQAPEIEIEDADLTKPGIQIPKGNLPLNYDLPNSNIALVDTQSKKVTVILAAFSLTGYTSSQEAILTTINFKAVSPVNQKTISFDPTLSKITRMEDGQDILQTPTSTGIFTIGNLPTDTITSTPGPTTSPPQPTITPTVTITPILTITPTVTPRPTNSPPPTNTPRPTNPLPTPTLNTCPRGGQGNLDCSLDGLIDIRDLVIMTGSWKPAGPASPPPSGQWTADLNGNNKINETDLSILVTNWGYPTLPPTQTPGTNWCRDAAWSIPSTQSEKLSGTCCYRASGTNTANACNGIRYARSIAHPYTGFADSIADNDKANDGCWNPNVPGTDVWCCKQCLGNNGAPYYNP